ncbi:hypothetical protein P7C71_g180, partial [Lecanoromycetidae sp. Uapishka_2]
MPSANPSVGAEPPLKPISISFGTSKARLGPPPITKKRRHAALADHSGSEDESHGGPQLVTAFDQSVGGAVTVDQARPKEALVIKVEKNRDWREESRKRRRKNLLPAEVQAQRNGTNGEVRGAQVERDEVSRTSGLQFVKQEEQDTVMTEGSLSATEATTQTPTAPKTADEEALASLLGNGEKKSTLTIPAIDTEQTNGYVAGERSLADYADENERFKADLLSRPDVPTLDAYDVVPVEDFGAAMLRGMGWKEGGKVGKQRAGDSSVGVKEKPRILERRPALLGIGAKEVPGGVGEEFGAWGKIARGKRKVDLAYSPVVMKNSVTGELLTEEELKEKVERKAKEEKDHERGGDWRERRDRNLRIDADRKGERKERDRLALENVNSRERSRSKESRRRDRSRSRERRRDRSRSKERRRRDRSRENGDSRYSSTRRHSRSRERDYKHSSSRRERSRSGERRHRRY